jgi:methanogenic corrinoid protein MtbC1
VKNMQKRTCKIHYQKKQIGANMSAELYTEMAQSIIDGDTDLSTELAQKAVALKIHPLEAITNGFVVGVTYIGDQFGKGEAFLPELVMAGEAMKAAIAVLEPELLKLGEVPRNAGARCPRDRGRRHPRDRQDTCRHHVERFRI